MTRRPVAVVIVACSALGALACRQLLGFDDPAVRVDAGGDAAPADAYIPDAGPCMALVSECVGGSVLRQCTQIGLPPSDTVCAWGCVTSTVPHCGQLAPAGGVALASDLDADPSIQDIAISVPTTVDSDNGSISGIRNGGNGVQNGIGFESRPNGGVFRFGRLTITGPVQLVGSRSAVFVAQRGVQLDAVLDARGPCTGTTAGPGGFRGGNAGNKGSGVGGGGAGGATGNDTSGGGGGGYGASGGPGGHPNASPPSAGGVDSGSPAIAVLVGGGGGGGGGDGVDGGAGAGGGGAIQIAANAPITIGATGGINVGGCGGGPSNVESGGGGGAGGTVLLEAPSITLAGGAIVAANGGGGAGGGGTAGEAGQLSATRAAGGTGVNGGLGGRGGAGDLGAGEVGANGNRNGGAGGGGVGRIRLNTIAGVAAINGAVISPTATAATQGNATVQ